MSEKLSRLFEKNLDNNCSPQELQEFWEIIRELGDNDFLAQELKAAWEEGNSVPVVINKQELFNKVLARAKEHEVFIPKRRFSYSRIAAAAVIILLLSVGGYFYFDKTSHRQAPLDNTATIINDVAPGKQGAVLTLANGKTIVLDTASNGKIFDNFSKTNESIKVESAVMEYATLTTPKARTHQLVLSDGSKVWLNAASSIHFPTVFSGKERVVQITGEVYFEVAKNTSKPFFVMVNEMQVEVIGTHFNINAYEDEALIKATLLEGSVKVRSKDKSILIKPGQQSQLNKKGEIKIVSANLDEAVAWKNGRFIFHGNNIQSVMRQLARWYNVEVTYQGNITDEEFVGVINKSRYENISQILQMLEKTGTVSFLINQRSVTVMPFRKK